MEQERKAIRPGALVLVPATRASPGAGGKSLPAPRFPLTRTGDHFLVRWRRRLRPFAWRFAPAVVAERDRRRQRDVRERFGEPESVRAWVREHGDRVTAGPLAGLRYPLALISEVDAAVLKLEGRYEREIQPAISAAIDELRRRPGSVFIDVGSSEGYYAVGVARATGCRTIAFDAAPSARHDTRQLAGANGAAVETRGAATERRLVKVAGRAAALLCDIEGGEIRTMTARVARALSSAIVIVELHGDRAATEVPERFRASHVVEVVACTPVGLRTSPTPWLVARPR
jgi:hypothetical protein